MLNVTFTAHTPQELKNKIAIFVEVFNCQTENGPIQMEFPLETPPAETPPAAIVAPVEETEVIEPKKPRGRPKKETMSEEIAVPAVEVSSAVTPPEDVKPVDLKMKAKDALTAFVDKKGMTEGLILLNGFGVSRLAALPESKYLEFIAEAKRLTV